jgi:predicted esterase
MDTQVSARTAAASSFGPVHILEPESQHTHTAILLHGRGSTGEEFAEEFLDSRLSDGKTLPQKLPGWRWVFPSSRELWSTAFGEEMPAWFEAHSLTDITARQHLQSTGIMESVRYLEAILNDEIERLGGTAEKLILGGISQGGAIGMWTLLCRGDLARPLGAFVAASTWLPFAANIENFLGHDGIHSIKDGEAGLESSEADAFVNSMMAPMKNSLADPRGYKGFLSTPVFLGHGVDDAFVDVELGRQARQVLTQIGLTVEWKEYSGAEQEGHWFKVPDEMDDIAGFLTTVISSVDMTNQRDRSC